MDRTERFYKIMALLERRRYTPREVLLDELGVSRATLKRDLAYLRDRMSAPIEWEAGRGYFLEAPADGARPFQLPGLWFSAEEVHALLTMEQLLERLQPGLLARQVRPLRERIRRILGAGDYAADEVARRIRILQMGARAVEPAHFQAVASAVLSRRRLRIRHYRRGPGEAMEREVSPQRLVHYRDNWYLDAWCHLREDLRAFSLDAIRAADILEKKAKEVSEKRLEQVLGSGSGIFSGDNVTWATLRFTPERARWVAAEKWHPDQVGRVLGDGWYELKVPYTDDRELLMDVLRFRGGLHCHGARPPSGSGI